MNAFKLNPVNDTPRARGFRGYEHYSPLVLGIYDWWVHWMNNRFFWHCPTSRLILHYQRHVTANHLEIGPGTGYLLDRCGLPGGEPRLVLCDMNAHCLAKAGRRLARYHPALLRRDALSPIEDFGECFDSAGMNYVLHCLPGDMVTKREVFAHIAACLNPGGVCFGSTLLSIGVPMSPQGRLQSWLLNLAGSFCNREDSLSGLDAALRSEFADVQIEVHGCVALFSGRKTGHPAVPRSGSRCSTTAAS